MRTSRRERRARAATRAARSPSSRDRRARFASTCAVALTSTALVGCGTASEGAGDVTADEVTTTTTTAPAVTASASPAATTTQDHPPPGQQATDATTPHADATVLQHLVIVTFDVDWRPEPELSAEQVSAQRDRVARAQARVLDALGEDVELSREHHATAQASLKVSDDGLARLEGMPEVAAVHRDSPDPPS